MKSFHLVFLSCLFVVSASAYAPHPSVLTVKYNDDMLPVVRVTGSGPYVMVDGKEKLIRSSPVYLVQEASHYDDNFVQTHRGALGGTMKVSSLDGSVMDLSAPHLGNLSFQAALTAKKTIKSGFAVMVFYTDETFDEQAVPASPSEVFVRALPELPAGKLVQVKIFAAVLPRAAEARFFVQIFDDDGREVRTTDSDHAWRYYGLRERKRLARAVEKYLEQNKGADHEAVPVSTPKPLFRPTAVLPKGEVIITLTVEPDGTVSEVNAGNIADDSARQSLTEAMSDWLFLPKLKAGQPVSNYIQVPLQF